MTWNYRIVRYPGNNGFGLHEVYYNDKGEACGMTEAPVSFVCDEEEGPEGVKASLAIAIADASHYPVFEEPAQWAKSDWQEIPTSIDADSMQKFVEYIEENTNAKVIPADGNYPLPPPGYLY